MKQVMRSMVLLAACVGLWSCTDDPTGDLAGSANKLVATPSSLFIDKDALPTQVDIELLDEEGSPRPTEWAITNVGVGLTVEVDETFQRIFEGETLVLPDTRSKLRLQITGDTLVQSSVTVTGGGQSITIPVGVIPPLLEATFSSVTPGLGDTVTITAPAGVLFTPNPTEPNDTSKVTYGTALAPVIVERDPSGTFIKMIVAPNSDAPATVTNLMLDYTATDVRLTRSTSETLTAPQFPDIPAALSLVDPRIGDTVTITSTGGLKIRRAATVTWPGGRGAIVTGWTADSSAISVLPQPGSSGPPTIVGVIVPGAAPDSLQFRLTLQANLGTDTLSLANQGITVYTGTDDPATAPQLTIHPVGVDTTEFFDLVSEFDQFYKFDVPVAPVTVRHQLSWANPSDIDMLFCNSTCTLANFFGAALIAPFTGATGANPEVATATWTTTGVRFMFLDVYDGEFPDWYRVQVRRTL